MSEKVCGKIELGFVYDPGTDVLAPSILIMSDEIPFDVMFRMQCVFSAFVLDEYRKIKYGEQDMQKIADDLRMEYEQENKKN